MVQIRHFRSVSVMDEKVFDPPPSLFSVYLLVSTTCDHLYLDRVPLPLKKKKNSSLYLETPSCFFLLSGKEEKGGTT